MDQTLLLFSPPDEDIVGQGRNRRARYWGESLAMSDGFYGLVVEWCKVSLVHSVHLYPSRDTRG